MNKTLIVASFVVIDEVLKLAGHESHPFPGVPDSEILWLAVMAAVYFQNHHERTVYVMQRLGCLSSSISISRYNRGLHQLAEWLVVRRVGELLTRGEVYVIDRLAIPVCKRVRASRLHSSSQRFQ